MQGIGPLMHHSTAHLTCPLNYSLLNNWAFLHKPQSLKCAQCVEDWTETRPDLSHFSSFINRFLLARLFIRPLRRGEGGLSVFWGCGVCAVSMDEHLIFYIYIHIYNPHIVDIVQSRRMFTLNSLFIIYI